MASAHLTQRTTVRAGEWFAPMLHTYPMATYLHLKAAPVSPMVSRQRKML